MIKKIVGFLLVFALMCCASSCMNDSVGKLRREVKALNRSCPINAGFYGKIVSVVFDEDSKQVQANFVVDVNNISMEELRLNEQLLHQSMRLSFSRNEQKRFLRMMVSAGVGLLIKFNDNSGESVNILIPLKDLKDMLNSTLSDLELTRLLLENLIKRENNVCPRTMGGGLMVLKVVDEGENVVYTYEIDEDMIEISSLQVNQEEFQQNIKDSFRANGSKGFFETLCPLGKGVVYRYVGSDSGKSVDIVFSNDEIREYLRSGL